MCGTTSNEGPASPAWTATHAAPRVQPSPPTAANRQSQNPTAAWTGGPKHPSMLPPLRAHALWGIGPARPQQPGGMSFAPAHAGITIQDFWRREIKAPIRCSSPGRAPWMLR